MHEINLHGKNVSVEAGPLSENDFSAALKSRYFQDWCETIDPAITVSRIIFQGLDWFGQRVGFLKLQVFAKDPQGNDLPGIIFMRGGGVIILPILDTADGRFVICVRQARLPIGSLDSLELPAGMLDGDGNFSGVAAKELREETGIDIAADELVDLTELAYAAAGAAAAPRFRGVFVTPGGSDEFIRVLAPSSAPPHARGLRATHRSRARERAANKNLRIPRSDRCLESETFR